MMKPFEISITFFAGELGGGRGKTIVTKFKTFTLPTLKLFPVTNTISKPGVDVINREVYPSQMNIV